jgi:hypothetical protein
VNLPPLPVRLADARSASLAVALLVGGCTSGGPAPTTSPATAAPPASASVAPTPNASLAPRTPTRSPSPTPPPKPVDSTVDGVAVRTLEGGPLSAPIDVVVAFGSVWVANHHGSSVTRVDLNAMTIQTTIKSGSGPGWFAVTDDAVWVSNQTSTGMTRVDPETNGTAKAGAWPPCGRPTVAFAVIWQPACDAHRFLRIDPTAVTSMDVASPGQMSVILVGSTLLSAGPGGLARLDPKRNTFTPIGGSDTGWLLAYDGRTLWASNEREVFRLKPADGSVVATLTIPEAGSVAFRAGRAWVTSANGLVEVDPKTNRIVRTLPLGRLVSVVNDKDGLWVTSYDGNSLMRVQP